MIEGEAVLGSGRGGAHPHASPSVDAAVCNPILLHPFMPVDAGMASWQGRRAIARPTRSMDAAIVGAPSGGNLVDAGVRVPHLPSHLPSPRLRSWSPPCDFARA
jgi:hypothetical protein